jgi:DNA invertase Pin-like site-specific DNA recombinase
MALRMLGYVRVSTEDQAAYGYGLAAQRKRIEEACVRQKDWRLGKLCRDEGLSGKSLDRPALTEALERIAAGKADGLIVAKLDRLTRSVIDFAILLEWFEAAGATLVALDFDLDTSTPGGRLIAHIMSAVAEWERDTIAQRTKDGLAAARAQGKATGRPAVRDRPELAEQIIALKESGLSLQHVCDRLNADAVPTARGASEWRKSAVQAILGYKRRPSRRKIANLPEIARR